VTDLSEWPDSTRQAEMLRLMDAEVKRPFNLSADWMMRATLLRLHETEHVLLLVVHHISFDGWSGGILSKEISVLYEAFSTGLSNPLPELSIQYADYAVWQRQRLQGELLETQLAYWKEQLSQMAALELPTDRPRPAVQTFRGRRKSLILPESLSNELKLLSRRNKATLFMTLLAAFQTLLHRYTGQEDIAVGSPIANRTRSEVEGLIGFFINTLVLRTDLSANPTFSELLGRIRKVALTAYANQDIPFEKLVEELHPERNLSSSPLFQVLFSLQNVPSHALKFASLTASSLEVNSGTAKFDLTFLLTEVSGSLRGVLEYNTDLFEEATISRILQHFETLLHGVVANPNQRLSDLPMLGEAERRQLLVEWNDTKRDYPRGRCIHQLFEAQVERTPEAVAVVFEDKRVTYRELNQRANQLAHQLRKLGAGPEILIGIFMERSPDMVVSLLAILKAGAAYVPIDPKYPQERIAFILDDGQVSALVTQQSVLERLPAHAIQTICVDTEWETIAANSELNPAATAIENNLAYVIYTSGSTGKPKGVAIAHRSTVSLLHWASENFSPDDLAGVLASTSVCFDLSVFELFAPLSWGGTVILAEDVLQLTELPAAGDVTLINTVPSAIIELLRMGGVPASVRTVTLAGEPLATPLVNQIYERLKVGRVFDLYGPSEDTTYSTCALRNSNGPTTIGRPIANTEIYLLDAHMQPVPIGVRGELHIGGDGLARGYLDRPDFTAEKYIPNAFSAVPGARLYKTGDLARHLPDGNIEFLGRIDHQVKIRGFRIELGEIEAVLARHPGVHEAVVAVQKDASNEPRLIAYIVPKPGSPPEFPEVRSFLKSRLPDYMIPSASVTLSALPLTPSGKVDRNALPAPDQSRPDLKESFIAPRTPAEEGIARIWSEVLKLDQVGVHDNFFDLGGHSLLATQVISRMREAFQIDLPLRDLFENPTVALVAIRIAQLQAKDATLDEMTAILNDLDSLSDEEAKSLLARKDPK
jgi:amino acid adenylation domain-containing protein